MLEVHKWTPVSAQSSQLCLNAQVGSEVFPLLWSGLVLCVLESDQYVTHRELVISVNSDITFFVGEVVFIVRWYIPDVI